MILTRELWNYFWDQQKALDHAFAEKARWQPSFSDRKLAYRIEKAEFINEYAYHVKWWKHTENDPDRIMDEFGDMIHFMAGYAIARFDGGIQINGKKLFTGVNRLKAYDRIQNNYQKYAAKWGKYNTQQLLKVLIKTNNLYKSFALALVILEKEMGQNAEGLRAAYDQKNSVNFKRIEEGY